MIDISNGDIKKDGKSIVLPKDSGSFSAVPIVGFDDTENLRMAKVTSDGKLAVDANVTVSSVSIGNVKIDAPDSVGSVATIHRTTNDDSTSALYVQDKRLTFDSNKNLHVIAHGSNGTISTDLSGYVDVNVKSSSPVVSVFNTLVFPVVSYITTNTMVDVTNGSVSGYKSKTFVIKNVGANPAIVSVLESIDNGAEFDVYLANNVTLGSNQILVLDDSRAMTNYKVVARSANTDASTELKIKVLAMGV